MHVSVIRRQENGVFQKFHTYINKPFSFEGKHRHEKAEAAEQRLEELDAVRCVLVNGSYSEIFDENQTAAMYFDRVNKGIAKIIFSGIKKDKESNSDEERDEDEAFD